MKAQKTQQNINGFAVLFAVLIASLVFTVATSIFALTFKQFTLSSQVRDSQQAFYAADAAAECALFWDLSHPGYSISVFGAFGDTLSSGLVGYWRLDDGSGTNVTDSSGNDNDGTLENNPTWSTGQIGGALQFDGLTNQRVSIPHDSDLFVDDQVTISAWIWRQDISNTHTIFSDFTSATTPRTQYTLEFLNDNTSLVFRTNSGPTNTHTSVTGIVSTYPLQQWVHIAATWNGTNVEFYVDGVPEDTAFLNVDPVTTTASSYSIGRRAGGAGDFSGLIDDVRMYDRALTPNEVDALASLVPSGLFSSPVSGGSDVLCNTEDITDAATGWDDGNGWDIVTSGTGATTTFDMQFSGTSCATVEVGKHSGDTFVISRGYNTCDLESNRRVERALRITY